MKYLKASLEMYGEMSFSRLKELSHRDPAYEAAWQKPGAANEMDIELWFDNFEDPELAKVQLRKSALFSA